ncbi:DUF3014 domain-containing protein [Ramlibacter sp. USB13]|uniref:DUF3014 domain-containing protein n=1 Tax=Ramlibacter cellulosilyticus TaxID=2764187 RepID=A0A923MQ44_9BURK|nr:DUF3014 domain-containing protein [Ramlibacter cellulosilyticus]MBC5782149.1 DUF3014 domain-containing protein [Ramlibacter cellulosilyticus]
MAGTLPAPDFRADPDDRADLRRRRHGGALALSLIVAAAAGAAAWFWWLRAETPATPPPVVAAAPPAPGEGAPAPEPAIRHPLPPVAEADVLATEGLGAAVQQLLGPAAGFLVGDNLARRIVATIDQLGREHAPPSMWPLAKAPEHFLVEDVGGQTVIAAANARRYAAMVDGLTAVDPAAVAALYRRAYPVLDRAWRELGMGNRYLNDRVIEVIDLLLRTPEPPRPVAVRLTEVKGPVPSTRPWLRYEFADPQLEALAAGQKILLRLDAAERGKVRQHLQALRRHLVQGR